MCTQLIIIDYSESTKVDKQQLFQKSLKTTKSWVQQSSCYKTFSFY
jgi:hypothetical protein